MPVIPGRWVNTWTFVVVQVVLVAVSGLLAFASAIGDPDANVQRWPLVALFVIVVLTSVPMPLGRLRAALPALQAAAIATVLLVTSSQNDTSGFLYASLLIAPVFVGGQRGGLLLALGTAATGAATWLTGLGTVFPPATVESTPTAYLEALRWTGIMLATAVLSAWVRRLIAESRPSGDVGAYTDAFRLLSELQHVARNLSLGLDPVTLAGALVDDLRAVAPAERAAVAVRGPEGRLSPLVGDLDDADHAVASQAWLSSAVGERDAAGIQRVALPVLMGDRVVAVASLSGSRVDATQMREATAVIRAAGPRLAAALLFDEVRRLATVDERLRLAREIHDGIAQELASLGYLLDDLAERVPRDSVDEVRALREHVRRVTGDLRLSIFDLRSGVTDEVTLGAALAEHAQRVAAAGRIVAHTTIDEQGDRLPAGTEIELLRIGQEAVTNVRKHARAQNLWIECVIDAPHVLLRVSDDGLGIDRPSRPGAMGLRGMRERATRIGGALDVRARPGGGTVVEVRSGQPDAAFGVRTVDLTATTVAVSGTRSQSIA